MYLRRCNILFIFLFSLIPLYSQFNTYSPYTRFGLGDLSKNGVGQNQAMGGTGIAIHETNRINYLNPAASASLDSTSVYFDFGANAYFNQYRTEDPEMPGKTGINNTWWNGNLHHIAFASSMGKYLGFSAGIIPYSSIGYNIKQEFDDYPTGTALDSYYTGDGGIMNFFMGSSVKFFDRVALGVQMNYLMGKLTRERMVDYPMNSSAFASLSSTEEFDLRKLLFGFGLQYKETFGEKFFFSVGGVYDLATDATMELKYSVINSIYPGFTNATSDSSIIYPDYPLASDTTFRNFTLPEKIGVGISLGIPGKLIVTGDYYRQDWTDAMSGPNYRTSDASSMHFGAEYIPNSEALRGFHKLMTYRLGFYQSNYYLSVLKPGTEGDYYQLKDYGITFGVGIPVRSIRSSMNVAFTLGTRGTTDYNLIKENYGIITFNVTLHDRWFRKRKFD